MLSNEFPINRGVRHGCPLSPILFNLFINDILDGCDQYGVSIGNKRCCGGLFADNIVLIAPSARKLQKLLNHVLHWANINEMTFGISKCATMVIKPKDFKYTPGYVDPIFYFSMTSIPKVSCYTYLGISFSEDIFLQPILSNMYNKVNRSSCIDHVIVNVKMKNYLNKASVCNTFNDISDHYPIILSCLNTSQDGYSILPKSKKVKWSNCICSITKDAIFSHNYFSVLFDEFENNDDLRSIDMVNKFMDTSYRIGNEIQAIVPTDLEGSAFHCPAYIKKLSHEKHLVYHKIKKFVLDLELNNIDEFHKVQKNLNLVLEKR